MGGRSDEQEFDRMKQKLEWIRASVVDVLFLTAIILPVWWFS
jgi:hypothetical protein